MARLEQKVNRISIGMIINCLLAIIWLVLEIIDYANIGEKIQVGTIMWVCLSIYILIRKVGGKL
jgi:hypothetical protein